MNKSFYVGAGLVAICVSILAQAQVGGPVFYPDPQFCNEPVDTTFIMSDAGPNLAPFTPAPYRRFVQVCNSAENAGAPVIKCGVAPHPTFHDAGILLIDGGNPAVGGVCWHDGGPSCGSTNTYNNVDGGPILADAGCFYFDGGRIYIDGGGGSDGGSLPPAYSDAGCNWTNTGSFSWKDGGFTFNDGGPCLADAGYCLVDGGPVLLDGGPQVTDAGWVYQDGGPYLGNTMPGDVLKVGDCITYPVGTGEQPICIGTGSLSTTVGVVIKECR